MRNLLIIMTVFASIVVFTGCKTAQTNGGGTQPNGNAGPAIIEEGWVSDNQFRVKAIAQSGIDSTDVAAMQKSAEAEALKKAKEGVVKQFVVIRMKTQTADLSADAYAVISITVAKEFHDIIENGIVIQKRFSPDGRSCTLIYEIEKNGLRKLVEQPRR